jgi:hypothetical protein
MHDTCTCTLRPLRSRKRLCGVVMVVSAAFWAIAASCLTAFNITNSVVEFVGYRACVLMALLGFYLSIRADSSSRPRSKDALLLFNFVAVLMIFVAWRYSDYTFGFWKMRRIPHREWQQMISELKKLGKESLLTDPNGGVPIHPGQMPSSFRLLSAQLEYGGGNTGTGSDPYVQFGTKERCWGLAIGSNLFSHGNGIQFWRIVVGDNGYFYVGPNY